MKRHGCRGILFLTLTLAVGSVLSAESTSAILRKASMLVGNPYRTGGIAPGGFDCSGFVSYLFRPTLPNLPRISRDMAGNGEMVEYGDWQPGDLLFYATGADPSRINHVALWYGDGVLIHSISDGPETGVVMTRAETRYWSRRYISSRRVLPYGEPGTTGPSESAPPVPEIVEGTSPWEDFDGVLRGDFESWKQADEEAFEKYLEENG